MLLLTVNCLQHHYYKGRGVFSTTVCANKVRNGPGNVNQGHSTAGQGSYHVHSMSELFPPASPYPTVFANLSFKTDCAN